MPPSTLHRLLGGSPIAVLLRLAVVSAIVGAGLTWLDVDPLDLIRGVERLALELWASGFDAVRRAGRYVGAGAVVVVPVWLALRLVAVGGTPRRGGIAEPLPGSAPDALKTQSTGWPRRNGPTASAS